MSFISFFALLRHPFFLFGLIDEQFFLFLLYLDYYSGSNGDYF